MAVREAGVRVAVVGDTATTAFASSRHALKAGCCLSAISS